MTNLLARLLIHFMSYVLGIEARDLLRGLCMLGNLYQKINKLKFIWIKGDWSHFWIPNNWRKEWQATLLFLPGEPHGQYEKAESHDTRRWAPRLEGVQCAMEEEWREITNSSRKNETAEPRLKWCSAVDVSCSESKVWCCEERWIRTWNVRSMKKGQGHGQARDGKSEHWHLSSLSELKWTGVGRFNLDDHSIYYCGQESLRRNGVALIVKKNPKIQYLGATSKMTERCWLISKANNSTSL